MIFDVEKISWYAHSVRSKQNFKLTLKSCTTIFALLRLILTMVQRLEVEVEGNIIKRKGIVSPVLCTDRRSSRKTSISGEFRLIRRAYLLFLHFPIQRTSEWIHYNNCMDVAFSVRNFCFRCFDGIQSNAAAHKRKESVIEWNENSWNLLNNVHNIFLL